MSTVYKSPYSYDLFGGASFGGGGGRGRGGNSAARSRCADAARATADVKKAQRKALTAFNRAATEKKREAEQIALEKAARLAGGS